MVQDLNITAKLLNLFIPLGQVLSMLMVLSHFEEGETNLQRHPQLLDLVRQNRWLEECTTQSHQADGRMFFFFWPGGSWSNGADLSDSQFAYEELRAGREKRYQRTKQWLMLKHGPWWQMLIIAVVWQYLEDHN